MPLDGLTTHQLVKELQAEITGYKIDKINQYSKNDFIFTLRGKSANKKLFISSSSNSPRINITDKHPENPAVPPMLCMFLRKRLYGCTVTGLNQAGLDRVVFIELEGTNEIGDYVKYKICLELIPKRSNYILLDSEDIILESTRKTFETANEDRQVSPGFRYILPGVFQNKLNILETDTNIIIDSVISNADKRITDALLNTLQGASPLICREIALQANCEEITVNEADENQIKQLSECIDNLRNLIISGGKPVMIIRDEKPFDISFTDIKQYGTAVIVKEYESFSELIDKYYSENPDNDSSNAQNKELNKTLTNHLNRATRKLEIRKKELEDCAEKDKYRVYGELITTNQYSLEKGALFYDLPNYYDDYKEIRINVDPALSPGQNAQKFFKEYNKLKTAETLLAQLINESETEIEYLKSVIDSLSRAVNYSDINEIKAELAEQGYLKKAGKNNRKKAKPLPPLMYLSDDGYIILAGKNNIQNEEISFRTADKSDSWFHTKSFPGSHVVVLGNGDIIPENTCRQAAVIAATNSSADGSGKVAVDYTEIRELKKPKGGKPGMVIYKKYNTMWAAPDKELCERLKKNYNNIK